jgi:tubulin polyglutamylase TTLL1
VCHSLDDVLLRLKGKERSGDGSARTFILQKYIEKPLLYKSRKFDIRHYLLITCFNGSIRAYWYPEGYIRTSSATYSLARNADLLTHLTNDAVQKHSEDYGKYEKGNKISYDKFQAYLDKTLRGNHQKGVFYERILPQMKELAINAVKASYFLLDKQRREHNFELLGMDFMIDQSLRPWLIEINTNPCLELSSPLLARLIPALVENTLRLCVDPFFPPPEGWPGGRKFALGEDALSDNRFELIFDETVDGPEV